MTMGTPEPDTQPVDATPETAPETAPETLSPEDAALFRQLLDDRRKQDQLAAEEAERTKVVPTHYLTLDNGEVVKSQGVMTHYGDHVVVNASLIPESDKETTENA